MPKDIISKILLEPKLTLSEKLEAIKVTKEELQYIKERVPTQIEEHLVAVR